MNYHAKYFRALPLGYGCGLTPARAGHTQDFLQLTERVLTAVMDPENNVSSPRISAKAKKYCVFRFVSETHVQCAPAGSSIDNPRRFCIMFP